jgi:hypothetical protein
MSPLLPDTVSDVILSNKEGTSHTWTSSFLCGAYSVVYTEGLFKLFVKKQDLSIGEMFPAQTLVHTSETLKALSEYILQDDDTCRYLVLEIQDSLLRSKFEVANSNNLPTKKPLTILSPTATDRYSGVGELIDRIGFLSDLEIGSYERHVGS